MKKKRKNKPRWRDESEGKKFTPREPRDHVATEYLERDLPDHAESICRQLMPHLRQRVLTRTPKPTKKVRWEKQGATVG